MGIRVISDMSDSVTSVTAEDGSDVTLLRCAFAAVGSSLLIRDEIVRILFGRMSTWDMFKSVLYTGGISLSGQALCSQTSSCFALRLLFEISKSMPQVTVSTSEFSLSLSYGILRSYHAKNSQVQRCEATLHGKLSYLNSAFGIFENGKFKLQGSGIECTKGAVTIDSKPAKINDDGKTITIYCDDSRVRRVVINENSTVFDLYGDAFYNNLQRDDIIAFTSRLPSSFRPFIFFRVTTKLARWISFDSESILNFEILCGSEEFNIPTCNLSSICGNFYPFRRLYIRM